MSSAETFMQQALAAVTAGDWQTAADRFERAAAVLSIAQPSDAVSALESAARLRLMADDPRKAADDVARAAKLEPDSGRVAKVNAEVVDRTGDLAARRTAWEAVVQRGDVDQRRGAHIQLGALARETRHYAQAAGHFEAALDLGSDDADLTRELRLELAIARATAGDHAGAETALAAIEAALPDADDNNFRARIAGTRGLIALRENDHARALAFADTARAGAVARADVMTYMSASILIADIYEQQGNLIAAYDTYVRARESLGSLIGDAGKGLVQPAITIFEERLGPDKFKEVWDAWVAMRKQAKASS